ncbi:MAG TPA: hypothetical protein VIG46_09180 [Candidatus Baltobacteraceae bacterium]|jgi:O-antigen/teichoic acid export membrane protein
MKSSNPTAVANRNYLVEMALCMGAYVAVLVPAIWLLDRGGLTGPLKFAVAAAPVVPVVFVFIALLRYFGRTDEFERRMLLESLGLAGVITALLAATYGFLENAGLPHLSAWFTWAAFMGAWLIGRLIVSRYYGT